MEASGHMALISVHQSDISTDVASLTLTLSPQTPSPYQHFREVRTSSPAGRCSCSCSCHISCHAPRVQGHGARGVGESERLGGGSCVSRPGLRTALPRLRPDALGWRWRGSLILMCWCAPRQCHALSIAKVVAERAESACRLPS
eukprot:scaffold935_cov222-Isochrysis_galbana.AAC.2